MGVSGGWVFREQVEHTIGCDVLDKNGYTHTHSQNSFICNSDYYIFRIYTNIFFLHRTICYQDNLILSVSSFSEGYIICTLSTKWDIVFITS